MVPYFLLFAFLFAAPIFPNWDDETPEESIEFRGTPNLVTYGGLTIQCDLGCGNSEEDPTAAEIVSILKKTIHKVFRNCSPLDPGFGGISALDVYSCPSWECDDCGECSVYNWPITHGFYLEEEPKEIYSVATYPQFLELTFALKRDVQFYHFDIHRQELNLIRSMLPMLKKERREGTYGNVEIGQMGELQFLDWGSTTSSSMPISELLKDLTNHAHRLEENLSKFYPQECEEKKEQIEKAIQKMDAKFRDIFTWCLKNHQPEGIAFHSAVENFIARDFDLAIEQLRWLINVAEKHRVKDELLSKLYLLKGQVQSEFGLYAEAIIGLTAAIQKNPRMKEAYFERAAAYFELGKFDRAIEDFLVSDIHSHSIESPTQIGLGIAAGILIGASDSAIEFIPSMIGTLRGLGSGLWALSKDPVGASQEFVNAAVRCVKYIKSHTHAELIQEMVPELKELVQDYDRLDDFQRGKLIGHVVGKYGMDIFLAKQSISFAKSYRDLKKANQVLTLEALTSPEQAQTILTEANQRWTRIHKETLQKGEIKIAKDKQGKHIKGDPNYEQLVKDKKNPSIFEHPDPEKLIREHGGTGIKNKGDVPGMAGYVEIVDFGEFIGYSVNQRTGEKIATTMGKIHYAKDGAHIVPYAKR
jgi:tetratricopeptide (TPR) repeat protein